MATVEETLADKSDAELAQLLTRLSDDLELQRAEVGLPVDETPQQIAAKRAKPGVPMPTPAEDEKMAEMGMGMGEGAGGEGVVVGEGGEDMGTETSVEVSPDGEVTTETETEMPADDAPRLTEKLVGFGIPDKAAAMMAKTFAAEMGGEDAALAELEGPEFADPNMGRLSSAFSSKYERKTGRNANEDRIRAMMPPGLLS